MQDCQYDTSNWIIDQKTFADYVIKNPPPKKKAYEEDDTTFVEDATLMPSDIDKIPAGEQHQQSTIGRMEDNTITEEQRKNLSIFLGGSQVEEPVKPHTAAEGFANAASRPGKNTRTITVSDWHFSCLYFVELSVHIDTRSYSPLLFFI